MTHKSQTGPFPTLCSFFCPPLHMHGTKLSEAQSPASLLRLISINYTKPPAPVPLQLTFTS